MEWLLYGLTGAASGFFAGLLGVGGGLVIVPVLSALFEAQGRPHDSVHHMALGTSLGVIVFTSVASLLAHHRRGAVLWMTFAPLAAGTLAGTFGGAILARHVGTRALRIFFVAFLALVAVRLFRDRLPHPARRLPRGPGLGAAGAIIGVVSALVGIGGGSMTVPFLALCNTPLRQAVGTSAALGLPIALAGAAGYAVAGRGAPGLPAGSLGFVHLPALAAIALPSLFFAPLGARVAHALPARTLRRAFALFLAILGFTLLARALA